MLRTSIITHRYLSLAFLGFNPLRFYSWPFTFMYRIFDAFISLVNRICIWILETVTWAFSLYVSVLAVTTRACASLGPLGDALLVPLSLSWMLWPLHVPLHLGQYSLFASAIPISLFLCQHEKTAISENWTVKRKEK